jgi:hypothetical protein
MSDSADRTSIEFRELRSRPLPTPPEDADGEVLSATADEDGSISLTWETPEAIPDDELPEAPADPSILLADGAGGLEWIEVPAVNGQYAIVVTGGVVTLEEVNLTP